MNVYIIASEKIKEKLKNESFRNKIADELGIDIGQKLTADLSCGVSAKRLYLNKPPDQIFISRNVEDDWRIYLNTSFNLIESCDRVVHLICGYSSESFAFENNIEINYCCLLKKVVYPLFVKEESTP